MLNSPLSTGENRRSLAVPIIKLYRLHLSVFNFSVDIR
jgi:hypothetical protein